MGDKFAEDCLKAHNEYRRKHGAQPLTLNKKVNKSKNIIKTRKKKPNC